jgi:nicotinamide mononucleotide transporter
MERDPASGMRGGGRTSMPAGVSDMALLAAFEPVGVVFGFLYVVLVIRQSLWCWPVGLVSAAAYVVVFLQARLYGQMALQAVYIALMFYGWHEWRKGGGGGETLAVSRTPGRWRAGLALAGAAFTIGLGFLLEHRADARPFWDAGTTAFSLVAQFMTTRKWIESWLVWISVDVGIAALAASQRLYPTAALYGAYLALAVLGLLEWRRSQTARPSAGSEGA